MALIQDAPFTAADGTAALSAPMAVGPALTGVNGSLTIQSNRARADQFFSRFQGELPSPHANTVGVTAVFLGQYGAGANVLGFGQRNAGSGVAYELGLEPTQWYLAGPGVTIATGAFTHVVNVSYTYFLSRFASNTLKVWRDSTLLGTFTLGSPDLTMNTSYGVLYHEAGAPSSTLGWQLDRFLVDDAEPAAAPSGGSPIAAISSGYHLRHINR